MSFPCFRTIILHLRVLGFFCVHELCTHEHRVVAVDLVRASIRSHPLDSELLVKVQMGAPVLQFHMEVVVAAGVVQVRVDAACALCLFRSAAIINIRACVVLFCGWWVPTTQTRQPFDACYVIFKLLNRASVHVCAYACAPAFVCGGVRCG
jgi:hypothetical protein